jgi:hypothetical protein
MIRGKGARGKKLTSFTSTRRTHNEGQAFIHRPLDAVHLDRGKRDGVLFSGCIEDRAPYLEGSKVSRGFPLFGISVDTGEACPIPFFRGRG